MRTGSKKIYHLEAWVIKVMSLYKVRPRTKRRDLFLIISPSSISSTTSTCRTLTDKCYPRPVLIPVLSVDGSGVLYVPHQLL